MRLAQKRISSVILLAIASAVIFLSCRTVRVYDKDDYYLQAVLKHEKEKFVKDAVENKILLNLSRPFTDSTLEGYREAFWAMEFLQYRDEFTDSVVNALVSSSMWDMSAESRRAFIELLHTLYKEEFIYEIQSLASREKDPRVFAMCISYLEHAGVNCARLVKQFISGNPGYKKHPIISALRNELAVSAFNDLAGKPEIPPLADIFKMNPGDDKVIIYSVQQYNRNYPGLLLIKTPGGKFLRDSTGEILSVPQLARAVTGLPGYITNGNTPQGIFSIQGIGFSKSIFIGPSPNLQLVLPYEVSPAVYFHNEIADTGWDIELYSSLLPESWKDYQPVYEAYYAGKAGRTEIIAHGYTFDPEYYRGASYYPFIPTLGCLTSGEVWSEETGKLIESEQIKFINGYLEAGGGDGYLYVINYDNAESPVSLSELKKYILEAEN